MKKRTAIAIILFSSLSFASFPDAQATTIAYDGLELVADSQGTIDQTKVFDCRKIYRIGDECVGYAGSVNAAQKWLAWYSKKDQRQYPKFDKEDDFEIMVVDSPNHVQLWFPGDKTPRVEITGPWAIGSGGKFALGALRAGRTAREAVQAAARIDLYTGGPLQVLKTRIVK